MPRQFGSEARYADGFVVSAAGGARYTYEDERGLLRTYTPTAVSRELVRAGKAREAADVSPELARKIDQAKSAGVRAGDIGKHFIAAATVKDEKGNDVATYTAPPPRSPLGAPLVSVRVWDYEAEEEPLDVLGRVELIGGDAGRS